ncbi:MAG: HEAT repeat domain-containing protein [Candidatus Brocadiia bacterium]
MNLSSRTVAHITVLIIVMAAALSGCSKGRDPKALVESLGSSSSKERKTAKNELMRDPEKALVEIKKAFKAAEGTERGLRIIKGTVAVLEATGTPEALETVAERIDDPNPKIRQIVIDALGNLSQARKKSSVEHLKKALQDENTACQQAAAQALRNMNYRMATDALEEAYQRREGADSIFAAQALYSMDRRSSAAIYLLKNLGSRREITQQAAAQAVLSLGKSRFVGRPFIELLVEFVRGNPDSAASRKALSSIRDAILKEFEEKEALPPKRTRDIMASLGMIGDKKSVNKLLSVLTESKKDITARLAAAEALGNAARGAGEAANLDFKEKIIQSLQEVKNREEDKEDKRVQIGCAISLCQLKNPDGVKYLLSQLSPEQDNDKKDTQEMTDLRIRAQEALTSSGKFVVPYLITALDKKTGSKTSYWAAATTLGELRTEKAIPLLAEHLNTTVSPRRVKPEPSDPSGEIPVAEGSMIDVKGIHVGLGDARWAGVLVRIFATLVAAVLLSLLGILIILAADRKSITWKAMLPSGIAIAVIALLIGLHYGAKAERKLEPKGSGKQAHGMFSPTRREIYSAVFPRDDVIPARSVVVRKAAALALARIGTDEAKKELQRAQKIHNNVAEKLKEFVRLRQYLNLVPQRVKDHKARHEAGLLLEKLGQHLINEQRAVLFYIQQGIGSETEPKTPPAGATL